MSSHGYTEGIMMFSSAPKSRNGCSVRKGMLFAFSPEKALCIGLQPVRKGMGESDLSTGWKGKVILISLRFAEEYVGGTS